MKPARTPDALNGKVMRQNILSDPAPITSAALREFGSWFSKLERIGKTANRMRKFVVPEYSEAIEHHFKLRQVQRSSRSIYQPKVTTQEPPRSGRSKNARYFMAASFVRRTFGTT